MSTKPDSMRHPHLTPGTGFMHHPSAQLVLDSLTRPSGWQWLIDLAAGPANHIPACAEKQLTHVGYMGCLAVKAHPDNSVTAT